MGLSKIIVVGLKESDGQPKEIAVNDLGELGVSVGSISLPSGAATEAKQDAEIAKLGAGLPAAFGAGGGVKIDGSGTALPISAVSLPLPSGASTAAKQPALGTAGSPSADVLTVQGVTSMTALKVDGSAVTQPVSAVSLPLPSGASTAAKQPALGTAGSASADVITVQGIASMTALKVDGSAVTQPISAASLPLPSGAATSAKQDSQTTLLGAGLPASLATGGALKSDLTTIIGVAPDVNSGNKSSGTLRVVLATDQPALTNKLLVTASGDVASASADSGNPVKIGGIYNTSPPTASDGQRTNLQMGQLGALLANVAGRSSAGSDGASNTLAWAVLDSAPTSNRLFPQGPYLYNGTTWDRQRGNQEISVLGSAARTATTNSGDFTNYNWIGVLLAVNVTAETGTTTLSLKLQGKEAVSSNYYDIVDWGVVYNSATDAPTTTRAFVAHPGAIAADFIGIGGNGTKGSGAILPRTWRCIVTHSDAGSMTYSVSAVGLL